MGNRRSVEKAFEHVGADARADRRTPTRSARPTGSSCPASARSRRRCGGCARSALDEVLREASRPRHRAVPRDAAALRVLRGARGRDRASGCCAAQVRRLDTRGLKLPHIGWNMVRWRRASPLTEGLPAEAAFYHVHSFAPEPADEDDRPGDRRVRRAVRVVRRAGNVFGAQCHPEKSSANGLRAAGELRARVLPGSRQRDPLPGDRHLRGAGRPPRAGRLRRADRLQGPPARGRAGVGRRRRAVAARRRPRRRADRLAAVPAPPRADRRRAGRPGAVRRRAALAAGGARRAARRRRAGDPRDGRVHRRRLPRRRRRRLRRPGDRLGRRARRQRHDLGLDGDDADAGRRRDPAPAGARRQAVRLLERRPRRDALGRRPRGGPADRGGRARPLPLLGRRRQPRGPGGARRAATGEPRRRHRRQGALRGGVHDRRGAGRSSTES